MGWPIFVALILNTTKKRNTGTAGPTLSVNIYYLLEELEKNTWGCVTQSKITEGLSMIKREQGWAYKHSITRR